MKKMMVVLCFLFIVMMVPTAHGDQYTLSADQIWVDTGIVINGGSIIFSGAQTFSDDANHPLEWTWGINYYYFGRYHVPRVWTDADGGVGMFYKGSPYRRAWGGGDPWLDNDEWLPSAEHGELLGYIGWEAPLQDYVKNSNFQTTDIFGIGTETVTQTGIGHVWIGINDEFVHPLEAIGENSGWATVDITVTPVPEPTTMLLLGLGLTGIAGIRRKFQK